MKLSLAICTFLLAPRAFASDLAPLEPGRVALEAEGQVVWQARNDAAIPGNSGTRFSLKDLIDSPVPGYRFEPVWQLSERQQLRGVLAPLNLRGSGTLRQPVSFQGAAFTQATPVEAEYKFNSYRVTYRYAFLNEPGGWLLWGGFTGKVRHANISLRQGGLFREKRNTGFVPLLHFAAARSLGETWCAELELDALAAKQGRAEDLRIGVRKTFGESISALLGYRLLEGGAGNDEVYTFSLFHYAVASLAWRF